MKRKACALLTALALCLGLCAPVYASNFTDAGGDAGCAGAVNWAAEKGTAAGPGGAADKPDLEARAKELDQLVAEAKRQFKADDHTPLSEPVSYKVLWLGYTQVTYGKLDFRMTASDREYLKAVALNFEKVVEEYAGPSVDISVDLHFVDKAVPLTKADDADWLYLNKTAAQADIDTYAAQMDYDTVFTTVQTAGNENARRNRGKDGYGVHEVMTGLKTHGMENQMGYSTFDLGKPEAGTYPLADPKIPSLYATAVAIHEWLHQLEYLGTLLDIEYPDTHAYMGPEEYPGYQKVVAGKDNYDFCEFYKNVLGGTVPYTDKSGTRHVGIYPAMWRLIKRDALNIGSFALKNGSGNLYLTAQEKEPTVTVSAQPSKWYIRYGGTKGYILMPETDPDRQLTLSNAWDGEGNNLHMFWANPGYPEAQLWRFTKNADGTYCIRTAYGSGRAVTAAKAGAAVVIKAAKSPNKAQTWTIE